MTLWTTKSSRWTSNMSFLRVSAATLVCSLYDGLRHLMSHEYNRDYIHDAVAFSVNTQFSDYGYKEDGNTEHEYGSNEVRSYVHLILCGNVHVWAYVGDECDPLKAPVDEWENISNHDSCWRDSIDSFLTRHQHKCCDKVQEHLPEKMRKAPKDVSTHHILGRFLGKDIFAFVTIKFERDETSGSYRFKLLNVKPSEKKLTLG